MNNFHTLSQGIISRSNTTSWEDAKKEWDIIDMEEVDELETCLCGHRHIKQVFTLRNIINCNTVRIGSTCVNRFIQKNSNFRSYKRIKKNSLSSVTSQLLDFAYKSKWINDNDLSFYGSIIRRRKLSPAQSKWKQDINYKIISNIKEGRVVSREK